MDITIRQVKNEDLAAVAKIEARCFPEAEAATKESLKQRIKIFPESFFVAEKDKNIVGFINGCIINETVINDNLYEDPSLHIPDGAYQTVFGLDVLPEFRNHGIAANLMNHLIKVSRLSGKKGLVLTCKKRLIQYYEKFGYANMGISKSVHGGVTWYDMILEF
ncbi:MAG: GNAT family N-acetyltransferase [Clostridium sp.]|jgi:ribosomal protein S18 acetylase RimI-like enzyme|uniref:GNAT family N-acetyltransferase n=1 Tax=Clostridium sp. TaxID=1506 RepID=UPI0025C2ECE3|nr:GNAT family N-acetyltransferase [Clostridium sp.]MCH3963563.1 GNAT family N-acetyltransferase [Clostridium sp.]MCI1714704.1 GNAT family N-acetyltransferase [Clostridium sp.]MCI1799107.1 GNAT family N-acetyltransferase [Clostridium sp.]MCI1812887.1 GNAT family N-acetyltransferase [Clostridium sp.]MCI1869777.1 GNAT family N-acetyltransferase [Clostridium sp.]